MDFQFSAEEARLQQDTAALCLKGIAPRANEHDSSLPDAAGAEIKANLKTLGDAGLLKAWFTDGGLDMVSHYIVGEEVAKACPSTWMSARASAFMCAGAIRLFGTPEQKERFLPSLLSGEKIGAMAYSEDQAGTDMGAVAAKAANVGGSWLVTGVKNLVANAPIADVILVLAYSDPEAGKEKGLSLFIVEKGAGGLSLGKGPETLGMRGLPKSPVVMDGCESAGILGGEAGKGFTQASRMLSLGTVGVTALCVGIGAACMELSTAHAKSRVAFGRRIGMFQDVGFKLADMFAYNDLGRMLGLRAAWEMNGGEPGAEVTGASAKLFSSEAASKIAGWGMQIFAGHGYLAGSGIERLYRDARFGEICEGTSEMQRALIANTELDRYAAV